MRHSDRGAERPLAEQVTLFALPKAFEGHFAVIQENALRSWLGQPEALPVVLLGDDPGTAAMAEKLGLRHCPDIACSPAGAPLLSSLFATARAASETPWLCYINADIILLDDFAATLQRLDRTLREGGPASFLLTTQRGHIDQPAPIDLTRPERRAAFAARCVRDLVWDHKGALDLFLYSRDLFQDLPDFALGRGAWDTWLLWRAVESGAAVIDGSPGFGAVHQVHDYSHHPDGWQGAWASPDAKRNAQLAEGRMMTLTQAASHSLTDEGLVEGIVVDRCAPDQLARFQLGQALDSAAAGEGGKALDLSLEALSRKGYFVPKDPGWRVCPKAAGQALRRLRSGAAGEALFEAAQAVVCEPFADHLDARRRGAARTRALPLGRGQGGGGAGPLPALAGQGPRRVHRFRSRQAGRKSVRCAGPAALCAGGSGPGRAALRGDCLDLRARDRTAANRHGLCPGRGFHPLGSPSWKT